MSRCKRNPQTHRARFERFALELGRDGGLDFGGYGRGQSRG